LDKKRLLELLARGLVMGILLGLVTLILLARRQAQAGVVEIHGVMSESGGWTPGDLTARVGEPLRLRLVADDVMHGFAVGQQNWPAIDLKPGQPVDTELVFDQPGKYTFYCTRWCGLNHWRMRGVIEVQGEASTSAALPARPLYVMLGINLDAPHPAVNLPERKPQAALEEDSVARVPERYLSQEYYQTHSPDQAFGELRAESGLSTLEGEEIWDLVATLWRRQTTPQALQEGARLYAANCAACHGEQGTGDGVMAEALADSRLASPPPAPPLAPPLAHDESSGTGQHETPATPAISGHTIVAPANFTDPTSMLGASPALLHGKILRGGMGTGMPYWGPIFTDEQVWSLVAFLWTFQFDYP